jgi:hypothetical protein
MDKFKADIKREHKLVVTANLQSLEDLELADKLKEIVKIPEEEKRQPDLSYISAILVSSGMNLNGAYFLPYEVLKAFNSIAHKPFDIEHEENEIVGHLCDAVAVDREGNILDVADLLEKEPDEVNSMGLDVVVLGVVYKDRFPGLVDDIKNGKYAVSMECYYSHYDIIVGDVIIPTSKAGFLDKQELHSSECDIMHGGKSLGTITVGRVL